MEPITSAALRSPRKWFHRNHFMLSVGYRMFGAATPASVKAWRGEDILNLVEIGE